MKSLLKFITSKHQLEALKLIEEKDAAKKFQKALIKFSKHAPEIDKNEVGELKDKTKFAYAMLDNIQRKIKKPLIKAGLRYKFTQTASQTAVKVACIVSHTAGHKERTDLTININHDDNLTVEQQTGAATSYAKRYCLVNALGLIINGDDSEAFNDLESFEAGKPVSKDTQEGDYLERERAKAEKEYKDKIEAVKAENEAFRANIPRYFEKGLEVEDMDEEIEALEKGWTKETVEHEKQQEPASRIIAKGKYCTVLNSDEEVKGLVNNPDITATRIEEEEGKVFITFDVEDQAMVSHKEERRQIEVKKDIKELAADLNEEVSIHDYFTYKMAVELFGFTEEELLQAYLNAKDFIGNGGKCVKLTPEFIFKSYVTIECYLNIKSQQ